MTDDEVDIDLVKFVKIGSFGKDLTDEFMILFNAAFLPGSLGITVKDPCSAGAVFSEFKVMYSFELRPVVGKDNGKKLSEKIQSQQICKFVEDLNNAFVRLVGKKKDEHEVRIPEKHGKQRLVASSGAENGVHLHNGKMGILFHKGSEIRVGTAFTTLIVKLHDNFMRMPLAIADFSGKIQVSNGKGILVDVVIDGLF